MKGIVFTEFLELVEEKFGLTMVDTIIQESHLASNGIYTSVGTYDFSEMLQLLQHLSVRTQLSIDDLLLVYAKHFFKVLKASYPQFLAMYQDPISMLSSIENHIHVEVRKIYPDAELPTFEVLHKTDDELVTLYKSNRAMYSFGLGLMQETCAYFNVKVSIQMEKIAEDGTEVKFIIRKLNE